MVRSDSWITEKALQGMIEPFAENQVRKGVISYGVSSYGYDIRVANQYKIFTGANGSIVDPKAFDERSFEDFEGDVCIIPPHCFALGRSLEYIRVPRELIVLCTGKSTYARCGILVNITPLEPEWEGFITIAISNTTSLPCKIYSGEGIAQLVFLASDTPCSISYKDKRGKYQGQTEIVLPKVS